VAAAAEENHKYEDDDQERHESAFRARYSCRLPLGG
jgi:hypothetical protein